MAGATLQQLSWGIRAHTGTDATTVTSNKVRLYGIHCQDSSASAKTITVTDSNSVQLVKVVCTTSNVDYFIDWGGLFVDGLIVTLGSATCSANFIFQ